MKKKIEELKQVCADMRKEIGQRQMESKRLKEDLESTQRQVQTSEKTSEEMQERVDSLKVRFEQFSAFLSLNDFNQNNL